MKKFIKDDGSEVYINPEFVVTVRWGNTRTDSGGKTVAILTTAGVDYIVRGELDAVVSTLADP